LGTFEVTLVQVNDPLLNQYEVTTDYVATLTPDVITDDGSGGVYEVVFASNFGGVFSWENLPSWITSDVPTFSDGDTIEMTIEESFAPERVVNLKAITESIDLNAIVAITQSEGDVIEGIVSAEPSTINDITLKVIEDHLISVVCADSSIQWQFSSNQSWVVVPPFIIVGSGDYNIQTVNPNVHSPAAIVTVTNINNPSDFKQITLDPTP